MIWLVNVSAEDERDTTGAGAIPAPVRLAVCGLPGASSVMVRDALLLPIAAGVKVMATAQLDPRAMLPLQLLDCVKSLAFVPVGTTLVMVMVVGRLFVSVTLRG